jgi:hypothetical protein
MECVNELFNNYGGSGARMAVEAASTTGWIASPSCFAQIDDRG